MTAKRDKALVLASFLEGINQAIGASRNLLHHQQKPQWFPIVAILEAVHQQCISVAVNPMMKPKEKPEKTRVVI